VPDAEPIWRALADPTRRAILDVLREGPRTTNSLAEVFPTTRFAVMKHLAMLVEVGLVTIERRGRERLNHLNPVPLQQTYERWARPSAAHVADATLRLAERAERPMDHGLDVRAQHSVRAGADRTWEALLELADWWPACWPEGARLVFEPRLGGRLGTTFGGALDDDSRGALWGVVSGFHPGRELRIDGTMNIPGPVVGQWRMVLEPAGASTVVTVEHRVLGPVDDEISAGFTRGWPTTLARLAARAES
jgi:DNA-binding transcriptional ArsR family regulator